MKINIMGKTGGYPLSSEYFGQPAGTQGYPHIYF